MRKGKRIETVFKVHNRIAKLTQVIKLTIAYNWIMSMFKHEIKVGNHHCCNALSNKSPQQTKYSYYTVRILQMELQFT